LSAALRPDPFADLTPIRVLDALERAGWRGDGRVLQLNSFENRVFLVQIEGGGAVVAKFYRPGRWTDAQIEEELAFAAELAASEVPVASALPGPDGRLLQIDPPRHAEDRELRFAVCDRKPGRGPELETEGVVERIGSFLGRLHAIGAARRFEQRITLDIGGLGSAAVQAVVSGRHLPPELEAPWQQVAATVLAHCRSLEEAVGPVTVLRLHGDCHLGNILWTDAGPHFVDLDDAMNGPAVQDLWMLLAGDAATARRQTVALIDGYEQFRDLDRRELRLVEAMRSYRMLHYSAWIARRWHDPAFPAAFPWFGTAAYWQEQLAQLREQVGLLDEAIEATLAGAPIPGSAWH
jgi:Ser/Thr protein kinase RdoA (MazF antagonist)